MVVLKEKYRKIIAANNEMQLNIAIIESVEQRAIQARLTEQHRTRLLCNPNVLQYIAQWLRVEQTELIETK